jgi:hypothetical protein
LLHAIDDATGTVLGAVFREREDAAGYLFLLRQVATTHGLPAAVYTDRHGIFNRSKRLPLTLNEQLRGGPDPTQVARTLAELGIQWIPASSPQAKGRVERLGGTFQDRLVSELRLAGVCDLAGANAFLPRYITRAPARSTRYGTNAGEPRDSSARQESRLHHPIIHGVGTRRQACRELTSKKLGGQFR